MLRFGYVLILALMLSACQKPDATSTDHATSSDHATSTDIVPGTVHPTAEALLLETDYVIEAREDQAVEQEGPLGQMAHRLKEARAIATVGVLEGDIYEMIGNVRDAALDEEQRIYVLDDRHYEVRIYDKEGRFLHVFGQRGAGPNEFVAPIAMAYADQGKIVVLDRNRHIKVFEPQDTTYVLKNVTALEYNPDDLCILNEHIYVSGFRADQAGNEAIVHVYTLAGEHLRSFGAPYMDANFYVRSRLSSESSIACSPETNTVQIMFTPTLSRLVFIFWN